MQVGWAEIAILNQYMALSRDVNAAIAIGVINTAPPDRGKL